MKGNSNSVPSPGRDLRCVRHAAPRLASPLRNARSACALSSSCYRKRIDYVRQSEARFAGKKEIQDVYAPILACLKDAEDREIVAHRFVCEAPIGKPPVAGKSFNRVLGVVVVP